MEIKLNQILTRFPSFFSVDKKRPCTLDDRKMTLGRQKGRQSPAYLTQSLPEKIMTSYPNLFCILTDTEKLMDEEINRMQDNMSNDML